MLQLLNIGWMTLFLTGLEEEIMWSGPLIHQTFLSLTFLGMLKEKVYSMKITDLNHMRECITSQYAEIDGNATYSIEFTWILQSISNYALKMMETILKILFINIQIE